MDRDDIPRQVSGFFAEEIDGETLLYRLGAHKTIHLNETASLIWMLCDGTRSVGAIIDALSEAFPEAGAGVAADTQEALAMLLAEDALIAAGADTRRPA